MPNIFRVMKVPPRNIMQPLPVRPVGEIHPLHVPGGGHVMHPLPVTPASAGARALARPGRSV